MAVWPFRACYRTSTTIRRDIVRWLATLPKVTGCRRFGGWWLAVVALCACAVGCGSTAFSRRHATSVPRRPTVLRVRGRASGACLFGSAFAAVASSTNFAVACPTWLPEHAHPTYFTVGASNPWQIEFRASAIVLDATSPSTPDPKGRLVSEIDLPHGYRVVVRKAGHAVLAEVFASGGGPIELLRLHGTRRLPGTMTRIADSLTIVPDKLSSSRGCAYAPLFTTMATLAGSRSALCPHWLPSTVSLPTGTGGYGPSVVEFYGPNVGLPHVVFAWTRASAPPGHLTDVAVLGKDHRVPIYLTPGQGQALFSNHYTAIIATSPHGPAFWVSWHRYYDDRHKDLGTLLRIIRSLVSVRS